MRFDRITWPDHVTSGILCRCVKRNYVILNCIGSRLMLYRKATADGLLGSMHVGSCEVEVAEYEVEEAVYFDFH